MTSSRHIPAVIPFAVRSPSFDKNLLLTTSVACAHSDAYNIALVGERADIAVGLSRCERPADISLYIYIYIYIYRWMDNSFEDGCLINIETVAEAAMRRRLATASFNGDLLKQTTSFSS